MKLVVSARFCPAGVRIGVVTCEHVVAVFAFAHSRLLCIPLVIALDICISNRLPRAISLHVLPIAVSAIESQLPTPPYASLSPSLFLPPFHSPWYVRPSVYVLTPWPCFLSFFHFPLTCNRLPTCAHRYGTSCHHSIFHRAHYRPPMCANHARTSGHPSILHCA